VQRNNPPPALKPWSVCALRNAHQQGLTGSQQHATIRPEHEETKERSSETQASAGSVWQLNLCDLPPTSSRAKTSSSCEGFQTATVALAPTKVPTNHRTAEKAATRNVRRSVFPYRISTFEPVGALHYTVANVHYTRVETWSSTDAMRDSFSHFAL
jgi:hypothetical protein